MNNELNKFTNMSVYEIYDNALIDEAIFSGTEKECEEFIRKNSEAFKINKAKPIMLSEVGFYEYDRFYDDESEYELTYIYGPDGQNGCFNYEPYFRDSNYYRDNKVDYQ